MMYDVFLSYNSADESYMQRIRKTLEDAGLRVWVDDTGIPPGKPDWQVMIEEALHQSACLVCVLTANTRKSRWVREELEYARLQEKSIYLVHIDGHHKDVVILGYALMQRIDVCNEALYNGRMDYLMSVIRQNDLSAQSGEKLPIQSIDSDSTLDKFEAVSFDSMYQVDIPYNELHRLIVKKNERLTPLSQIEVNKSSFIIGRDSDSDLTIDSMEASRKHCQFLYTPMGFVLLDLASTNGTLVNKERIIVHLLSDRDVIKIGEVVFLYRIM